LLTGPKEKKKKKGLAKIKLLGEARVYRPVILVSVFFFVGHCTGLIGLRPFLVNIFRDLDLPVSPYWSLVSNTLNFFIKF
jgi:hypothetical protein